MYVASVSIVTCRLSDTCASIISLGVEISMMTAIWHEHTTIVRRMRKYYCHWLHYCDNERYECKLATIARPMRKYHCLWRNYSHHERDVG